MKVEKKWGTDNLPSGTLEALSAKTDYDELMTVLLNQDIKRDKRTDDREVLSVGRLRLVATHMNRSLTKVRDRSAGSTNVKDNLGHKITANVATLLKRSAFNHVPIKIYIVKDTTNSMSKRQIANSCNLKKRTLQLLLSQKVDTTNICSLKKWTVQSFVVLKSRH